MEATKRNKVANTPILNLLAKNVRYYRGKLQMSQERLAELADLHPTYISNIEQGHRNLSLQNVANIADALGVTVPELLTPLPD